MSIQITQTYAKIGVETSPAKLNIKTQMAELQLHRTDARVEIHNEFPRVEISNRECFNTSGLKDIASFMREAVQLGYQASAKYISKTSGDGERFAAIENPNDPIPEMAQRDAYPEHEFGIDFIPKARPQISVTGKAGISSLNALGGADNGVEGTYVPGSVRFDVTPYDVRIYMIQKPSIDIKDVGKNVDVYK